MASITCPKCGKSLKVNDNLLGKRVRCPGCKNPFVIPDAPVVELADEEEEEERVTQRPSSRRPRDEGEDEEPPPRRRRPRDEDEDEDEDEEPRRPKRRSARDDRGSVSVSSAPLVYGILACVLSCAPIIGFILGGMAMSKANAELDRLRGGKRAENARSQLRLAKILGIVGMCLSFVMLIVGIVLRVMDKL